MGAKGGKNSVFYLLAKEELCCYICATLHVFMSHGLCFPLTYPYPMYHSSSPFYSPPLPSSLHLFSQVFHPLLLDREPISITKSLLCEPLWASQITPSTLPDTDLSSSYCTCHLQRRTNLNKGTCSLVTAQDEILGGKL